MSDNSTNNFSLLNAELPESVDNALKNLTDLPSQSVGQTLSDCWFLVFGGISQLANKRKLKYAKALEEFKKSLEDKVSSIPDENRLDANTQLVMPALENVKYCVEEKELREMFANLISASLDNQRQNYVHPSFAEILKTLTPLDAQNLMLIRANYQLPICNIIRESDNNPSVYSVILQNLFLMNPNNKVYEQQSLSISSLLKQGLIEVPMGQVISTANTYLVYEHCDELLQLQTVYPGKKFSLKKGLVRLTPLGHSFLEICCPD